ncbi:MAG: DUF262 domain-containing protein [Marinagarivorans sp.]
MDTDQKTESLAALCEDIENDHVRLPEFQRDFVWEIQKTYDLFDSLVRNIFVGSLIYGIPSFEITVRAIDVRPRSGKGSRKKLKLESFTKERIDSLVQVHKFRLLLDGQQRATSIYRALKGDDEVYLVLRTEEELENHVRNTLIAKRNLEQVFDEFRGDVPAGKIGIKLSDVYRMHCGDMPREADRLKPFLESTKLNFSSEEEAKDSEAFNSYITQAKNLEKLFNQEKLVSYYLLNTDQDKFALFFERSNSKGIQLSFIDILAAKLYSGFNLRQNLDDFKERFPGLPINREVLVRAISCIVSGGKDTGRAFILSGLNSTHFQDNWDSVTNLYQRSYEYLLTNKMIVGYAWMPYENMLIPLMMFLRHIRNFNFSNISEKQKRVLHLWFWQAIMSRRYSSAAQTHVLADAQVLESVANEDFSAAAGLLRKLRPDIASIDELRSIHKKYDAVYKGILNLINFDSKGLTGLENGATVSNLDEIDDHHIFPRDYLRKSLVDAESDNDIDIDSVINRCLIPRLANQKAGNKAPSVYLGELAKRNADLQSALRSHLVPPELILGEYDTDYEGFLQLRGESIMSIIRKHVIEPRMQFIESN